jgi:hypothetical protein
MNGEEILNEIALSFGGEMCRKNFKEEAIVVF